MFVKCSHCGHELDSLDEAVIVDVGEFEIDEGFVVDVISLACPNCGEIIDDEVNKVIDELLGEEPWD